MPLHAELLLTCFTIFGGLCIVTAACFFAGLSVGRFCGAWPLRRHESSGTVPCRYCYFGRAHACEETVRVEGDDLIQVTCYVCRTCALPQWRVERTPVLKRAA